AHLVVPVDATSIYRCVGADGVVKFQDQACRIDESSRRIELPDAPSIQEVTPPRYDAKVLPAPSPSAVQRDTAAVIEPGPAATLCTREDGSRYLSDSGRGELRAVPLGVLGIPRDSLADAYGGRGGIGVSAPGLRNPPSDRSRHGR